MQLYDSVHNKIFRLPTPNSKSYVAGIFDAAGHVSGKSIYINGITVNEAVMLQQLGVHTSGERIRDVRNFLDLVRGFSVIADGVSRKRAMD